MNILALFSKFQTEQDCYDYLEGIRFKDGAYCPLCGGTEVRKKTEAGRTGRWQCKDCKSSFNVLSGTFLQKTRVSLRKWVLAIGIMVDAKKSLSSYQLARDLELTQMTAWYMQQRIRMAMAEDKLGFLAGVVEADEAYIGGKKRKPNKREDDEPHSGGANKTAVIGVAERGGKVVAMPVDRVTADDIEVMFAMHVDERQSVLMTDTSPLYKRFGDLLNGGFLSHETVNHNVQYADGDIHVNMIEGFWQLLKRALYGSHHHYTRFWMPFYVAEASWKYNHRKDADPFGTFFRQCFTYP